jgi:Fe-S-cluster containining protein
MSSLPLVVIQAQKAARSNPELKSLLKETMMKLSLLEKHEIMEFINNELDHYISLESESSTCLKGCHHCCFHPITVTPEESSVLKRHFRKIDQDRLKAQRFHFRDDQPIAYAERACVFLKEGECSVYEDRPVICRLTHVKSLPADCHLEEGVGEIEHLKVSKAAIIATAFLLSSTERELLPLSLY